MSKIGGLLRIIMLSVGFASVAAGVELFEDLEGEAWGRVHSEAAEKEFTAWKATGEEPEALFEPVQRGDRQDLWQRRISGDRMAETEIKPELPVTQVEVAIRDLWCISIRWSLGDDFEELDCRLTMFSIKGKRISSIKGNQLIPAKPDEAPLPLIGWARSDQSGKAWIVSVGSEEGRGWVRVTPDGKWSAVECPWTECFPQQLGKRGFYIDLKTMSDDGKTVVSKREAGHGIGVGWPTYKFPGGASRTIPDGGKFAILPGAWTVFIESWSNGFALDPEEREKEAVWFFDANGNYQHWTRGRGIGASLKTGGLWIRLLDETSIRIDKNHVVGFHGSFKTKDKQALIPVEIHDDIGLGLFLEPGEGEDGDHLVLGTWTVE